MPSVSLTHAVPEPLSLEVLVDSEQGVLFRLARRLGFEPDDARELVQATFADAWEKRAQLKDPQLAAAWLRKILVSRAMGQLRRREVRARLRHFFLGEPDFVPPPELEERSANAALVAKAVAALPVQQRTAISLRYFEGLELDAIADAMGISRGTVRIHLYRGLARLKALGERP